MGDKKTRQKTRQKSGPATPKVPARRAKASSELQLTSSEGGPVVMVPAEIAGAWRGTRAPVGAKVPARWTWGQAGGPETDYDRALEPNDYTQTARGGVGWLDVATSKVIVLSDELPTLWLPAEEGGLVVRGPEVSREAADELRAQAPIRGWTSLTQLTLAQDGRVFLFDSAAAGATQPGRVAASDGVAVGEPGLGTWEVSWATVDDTDYIRLARPGAAPKRGSAKAPVAKQPVVGPHAAKPPVAKKPVAKKPVAKKPVAKKRAGTAGPKWKTRSVDSRTLERARPERVEGLTAVQSVPGGHLGFAGKKPAEWTLVLDTGGKRTRLSAPGQLCSFAVAGTLVVGGTPAGRVVEFPLTAGAAKAKEIFAERSGARVLSITPLRDGRLVLALPGTVLLLGRAGEKLEELDGVSVKPNEVPTIDVIDDDRWLVVGRDPRISLFAILPRLLRTVQTWTATEGGVVVRDGKAYLYGDGRGPDVWDELLNLKAVHDALG